MVSGTGRTITLSVECTAKCIIVLLNESRFIFKNYFNLFISLQVSTMYNSGVIFSNFLSYKQVHIFCTITFV